MSFPDIFENERYRIRFIPDFRLRNKISQMKHHGQASSSPMSTRYRRRVGKSEAIRQFPALSDSWVRDNFRTDLGQRDYEGILRTTRAVTLTDKLPKTVHLVAADDAPTGNKWGSANFVHLISSSY